MGKAITSRHSALTRITLVSLISLGCSLSVNLDLAADEHTLDIFADRGWQDTGISLAEGEEVLVQVRSGKWFEDPRGVWHDASGDPNPWICGEISCHEPLPDHPKYALIGKIGEQGRPFLVGEFSRFYADQAGRLFLRANYGDEDIPIHDPEGSVEVLIEFGG